MLRAFAKRPRWLLWLVTVVVGATWASTPVLASTPETLVTVSPAVTTGWAAIGTAPFVVTYTGTTDGANVVIDWGDGQLDQATAVNYQVSVGHTYMRIGVFVIQADVFTSNCPTYCTGVATIVILLSR